MASTALHTTPILSARACGRVHAVRRCSGRHLVLAKAHESGNTEIFRSQRAVMKKDKAWIQQELAKRNLSSEGLKPELAGHLLMAMTAEDMEASPVDLKPTMTALKKLRKVQLICVLKQRNLDASGSKDVLVQRLLTSLKEARVQEDLASEALKLARKLTDLDVAVTAFKQKMNSTEDSRLELQEETAALLHELQAMQRSEQQDASDIDTVLENAKRGSELLPVIAKRKEKLMALKEDIAAKEAQALELRAKLRLVEQAKLVGVQNIPEEEIPREGRLLVTAFVEEDSAPSAVNKTTVSSAITVSNPTTTSFYTSGQEMQTASSAYSSGSGPGRMQVASARSIVNKPPTFAPVGPGSSTSPAAANLPSAVPAAAFPVPSSASELARRPEAVGVAIAYGLMTMAKGLKFLLN